MTRFGYDPTRVIFITENTPSIAWGVFCLFSQLLKKVENCPRYEEGKKKDASGASAQRASFFAA
jgi:hypothetical protein